MEERFGWVADLRRIDENAEMENQRKREANEIYTNCRGRA